jgi:hypothetical protein
MGNSSHNNKLNTNEKKKDNKIINNNSININLNKLNMEKNYNLYKNNYSKYNKIPMIYIEKDFKKPYSNNEKFFKDKID